MSAKPNPHRIPRTQADVDKAWEKGVLLGVHNACAMFMNVLRDKYGAHDTLPAIWADLVKLSEEVKEGRVKIHEITRMLKEEYDITI